MISISGIKLTRIEVTRTDEADKVEGSYSLMSTEDKVLAKQSFNGYNDVKIELSSDTKKALNVLLKGIKNDIQDTLGLKEEKK